VEKAVLCLWADAGLGSGNAQEDDTAKPQQQVNIYSTLILALPENDRSVIEIVTEADKSCGFQAWTTSVDHYEDDGVYRLAEPLQDMEKPQEDGESSLQSVIRLICLQRQLPRGGGRPRTASYHVPWEGVEERVPLFHQHIGRAQ
jgi:hypothetical protein